MLPDRSEVIESIAGEGGPLPDRSVGHIGLSAEGAVPAIPPILKNGSVALGIPTRLAEIVGNLRASWLAGPALIWSDLHAVHELASTEVDKRIAILARSGFFQFSQLLCGLEVLLLELQKHGVVHEETLLGCEQLLVDLRDSRCRLIEIADANSRGGQLLSAFERCNHGGD